MNAIMMLHRAMAGYLAAQGGGGGSKYIEFADPAVEAVLMAKGVSSDGVGITTADVEKVTSIGTWFKGNTAIKYFDEFEKFTGVTEVLGMAFGGCSNLESITIPKTIVSIAGGSSAGDGPFLNCSKLKTIALHEGITTLGFEAFKGCSSLIIPRVPNSVTTIGGYAFYGIANNKIEIPEGVTKISRYICANCPNLKTLVIPSTTTSVDWRILENTTLDALIVKAVTPPTADGEMFKGATVANIYVPDGSVDAYKSASVWAWYESKIKPFSEYNG